MKVLHELGDRFPVTQFALFDDKLLLPTVEEGGEKFHLIVLDILGNAEVIADTVFNEMELLSIGQMGDSTFLFGQYFEDQVNVPHTAFLLILDSNQNEIAYTEFVDSAIGYHYFVPPVFNGDTIIVAGDARKADSSFNVGVFFYRFLRDGTFLDFHEFDYPGGYKYFNSFAKFKDGYMLCASVDDTSDFNSHNVIFFYLDASFTVVKQFHLSEYHFVVDTTYEYGSQTMEFTCQLSSQNDKLIVLGNLFGWYTGPELPFGGYVDYDIALGKLDVNDTAFSDTAFLSNIHQNSFVNYFGLTSDSLGNIYFSSTEGASQDFNLAELSDSYVKLYSVDSNFNLNWERTFFEGDGKYQYVRSMDRAPDGGFIIVGHEYDHDSVSVRIFIIKTDSNGNVINSVDELAGNQHLVLYPNPASSEVWFQSEYRIETIQIIDPLGKVNLELQQPAGPVSVAGLPNGIYSIVVQTGRSLLARKLVVAH